MPIVQIDWLEGRDDEKKRILIEEISKSFEKIGVSKDNIHIIIRDTPSTSWGHKGVTMKELRG